MACNAPWNILSTKSPEKRKEARAIRHLEKAKSLDPDLFKDQTERKFIFLDSFVVKTRDSVVTKEKVNIVGRTEIVCDTINGKPKPFYQEVNTGLVQLKMWTDSSGIFHYNLNQDSIHQRFRQIEQEQKQRRDSLVTNTIMIPKIVYKMDWKRALLCLAIGVGIGLILLHLLRYLSSLIPLTSPLRRFFKKTSGN